LLRPLLLAAVIASAATLAGCNFDNPAAVNGRHMQPLPERLLAEISHRNMTKESPILLRIFKEESELEVWKQDNTGRFELLRAYPICRWSGELGPKIRQGDRQAPEGFYTITPDLMNPNSNYYLAINTGFPNAYDRANGRTGDFLMIHGDCLSAGCYAMTDEQIAEIYALARESFFGGQKSFQIQAYPFRMTPLNLARHRDSPHMAFWKMLKQGYDHFELTRLPPKVDVCDRRYVFDADSAGEFNPSEGCPAYRVPQDLAAAVRDKEWRDEMQIATLIKRGTPVAPVTASGGMHRTFLSALSQYGAGTAIETASGTIPAHVNPPAESAPANESPRPSPALASAAPTSSVSKFLGNGFESNEQTAAGGGSQRSEFSASRPEPAGLAGTATRGQTDTAAARPTSAAGGRSGNAGVSKAQLGPPAREGSSEPQSAPSSTTSMLGGAQPALPAGAFYSRFGEVK
jgi:murein L,D-transpeptidase YafK